MKNPVQTIENPLTASETFLRSVANLSMWNYDDDDGEPLAECEEPDDGYLDSHMALMNLIEEARAKLESTESTTIDRAALIDEARRMTTRLTDSEEHAVEAAIPPVAEDAAALIERLIQALSR